VSRVDIYGLHLRANDARYAQVVTIWWLLLCFSSGWLEPLLDRIAREASTVVCPVIDVIDDSTLEFHYRDAGGVNVGGFDWNLQVKSLVNKNEYYQLKI